MPVLQQPGDAAAPEIQVVLDDLRVNPSTGSYISGNVYATIAADNPLRNHPDLPLTLNEITYTTAENQSGQEVKALFFSGNLKLFGETLGETQTIDLYIQSDGLLRGGFSLPEANIEIPLDGPDSRVVVAADSIAGSFNWNPQNRAASTFDIGIGGGFQINDMDGEPLVRSDIGISYNQNDFSLNYFDPSDLLDAIPLDFGFFNIEIPRIESLNLSYNEDTGFNYYADLDFLFEINVEDRTIPFPLKNVEIRSDLGFVIPSQDIHEDSVPGLELPSVDFGIFNLQPLAFRMERDTLNWNNFSPGDLLDIIPNIDFELTFPQFEETVPALASQSVTLLDASFSEGLLNGDLVSLDFSETPIFFPLGSGAGINIEQIGGELFSEEGLQRFAIELDGSFEMPEFFTGADEECPRPEVSVNLTRSAAVEGSITSFTPCGDMNLGPIQLAFGDSDLTFSVSDEDQSAVLSGSASASILTEQGVQVDATGQLDFDLIAGQITDGSILVDTEFPWHYPSSDSLFTFNVDSAELTPEGLVFNAGGSVQVGEGSASVDFNNMTFDLVELALVDGSATITNEFAFDVGFGPTNWTLSDPASDPDFSQGVRMTVPENVTIDATGLTVTGQSGASLYFGEESYDQIMVDFVDTRFRFEPNIGIADGRADFILQEEGEDPVRLGWYDSDGFHADNLLAAVPLPDTLALPTKDIAYIVLKDEQGNNLVQSESVDQGLSISTSQPIDLVLAAFENSQGEPYTMSVDFEDIIINAAFEMISGTITVDLEESPLNLANETDFPLGITQFQYRRESGENHFYADAKLVLPGELEELIITLEDLKLGPDGFADMSIALGEYSDQYDSDIETEVISRQFADGAFGITVRGVEVEFGSEPSYRISGEVTSNLLRSGTDEDDMELTRLFLAASYDDSEWMFNASAAHIPDQHLPIGSASLILEELDVSITDEHFALLMDARFTVPEILGDDMQIGIEGLSIGTAGISLDQINTDAFDGQTLSLFGQEDNLTIGSLGLEITDEYHLIAELNGDFYFLERTFSISELRIGSDGTFELGDGSVNLITEPVDLLGDNLVLTTLEIGVSGGAAKLTALADLNLPEPVETSSEVGFSINHFGAIELINPVVEFTDVSMGIDGIGSINLHQAHFEVNSITNPDFAFYAMADVTFEHESTVSGKIEFGEVGNVDEWGIRYQYGGGLEWRVSNDPTFTFENEMFAFTIEAGQAADLPDNEFGITLGVDAALQLAGVGGSIKLDGMILTRSGIYNMGTLISASLDVGPVNMSLSEFEYSPDGGELVLEKASGDDVDQNNMEIETETIQTIRHLTFAGEVTFDGIFSGSVENFLYYQTENETYLNIQNVEVDIMDQIELTASLEYQTFGDSGDFRFMVAGSAYYSPPSGQEFGMAAMGRIERSGDDFGFAVFVSASIEVPIIPGIITINTLGGGFFYNGVASDFEQVLAISDYEMSSAQNPWEAEDEGYSFAILLQAGAGIIGSAGNYYVNGETFLMITPYWVALDVTATLYMGTPAEIELGMYLGYRWDPHTEVNGSVTARIDNAVAEGTMGLYFQAIWDEGDVIWALNGEIDNFTILNVIDFDGSLIAGATGFYADLSINASLDVKIITARVDFYLELWWLRGQQFGAYTEFSAQLSMFKGAFKGGGDFTGALIVGSDLFVYATATVYVDILWVFSGDVTGYVAVENGRIKGGRNGSDEYDQLIAEARDQAQNMNEALNEALSAAQDFEAAIEPNKIDEGVIAQAGEAILGNDLVRIIMFNWMLIQEKKLTGSNPELYESIVNAMQEIDDIPTRGDYSLNSLRSTMNQSLDALSDAVNDMYTALDEIEADAVQWQQLAQQSLEDLIQNPVQSRQLEWSGEGTGALPPDFSIDESIDNANQASLESFRAEVEQLNQQFLDAIETIGDNIEKIEVAMSPDGANVHGMAMQFEQAIHDMERFYAHYGGLYWDINRWARISKGVFDAVEYDMEQAVIDQAAAMLATQNINVDYHNGDYSLISRPIPQYSNYETTPSQFRPTVMGYMNNLTDFNELTNIAAWRQSVLYYFGSDGVNFHDEKNSAEDTFDGYLEDNRFRQYFTDWVQRAIEFWYTMPVLGYDELMSASEQSAQQVYTMYEDPATGLPPLIEAYGELTEAIDDIYSIQHSMHATYEEVLRQYVTWYEDIYDDGEAAAFETLQQEIQTKSLPPTITNISVSNNQFNYVNEYTISWNATHPTGDVVENSYYLSAQDYSSDVFIPEFMTVGSNSSATRYLFKREMTESQRNMNIRVRARGPSGISIRRLANRNMGLNPPPKTFNNSLLAYQPVYGQAGSLVTIYQDPEPPVQPEIEFPYETEVNTYYFNQPFGMTGKSVTAQTTTYWSNSTTSLTFNAWSMDETYDISQFEFKIGDEYFGEFGDGLDITNGCSGERKCLQSPAVCRSRTRPGTR
jgi:large repetitive protein